MSENPSDRDERATTDRQPNAARRLTTDGGGGREVVVPLRVYKAVTVFSTLFSVVLVVAGFSAIGVATNESRAAWSEVNLALALLGLGTIAAGAVLYAFSTRFRMAGMRESTDDHERKREHAEETDG